MSRLAARHRATPWVLLLSSFWCPSGSAAQGVIDPPIVHWTFDETSGNAINGGSLGSSGDATTSGVTATAPLIGSGGGAYQFNGSGRVTPGGTSGLNSGGPWDKRTVSLWFRADTVTGRQVLFGEGGTTREFLLYIEDGFLYAAAENRANDDGSAGAAPWGNPPVYIVSPQAIEAGRVYHVVAMLDGTFTDLSGQIRGYFDGQPFASVTGIGGFWPHNPAYVGRSANLRFHDNTTSNFNYFSGAIDDVKIWNSAPTDQEIFEEYLLGIGLVGHYKLDETSGTTAADASGFGNDGIYVNSPTLGAPAVRALGVTLNTADSDDRIDLPTTLLDEQTAVSVSWWMQTTKTGQTTVVSGANAGEQNEFILFFPNDRTFQPHVAGASLSYTIDSIATGRWNHFVYQLDRVTGAERLHVNGQPAASGTRTATTTPLEIDSGGLVLAQEQDSVGGGFDASQTLTGALDEVRFYNRLLTDDEVAELFGLVGHWKFEETSGTLAADSGPFANDGAYINSPTLGVTAVRGFSAQLDGVSQHVQVPGSEDHDADESVTAACWARSDTELWNETGCFVSKRDQFILGPVANTTQLALWVHRSDGWTSYVLDLGVISGFDSRSWHHYAASYDGVTGGIEFFVDGVLKSTATLSALPLSSSSSSIYLGYDSGGAPGRYFDGALDEVQVFNRPITEHEAAEMFGLVGHWKFDETTGLNAADATAFRNDATLSTGDPAWVAGRVDGAIEFDGNDEASTGSLFQPPATGAVSFWFRPQNNFTSNERLFGLGDAWEVRADSFGFLVIDLGANGIYNSETDDYANAAGAWHHIAAMYDSDADVYALYGDGALLVSGSLSTTPQAAGVLTFGARTGSTQRYSGALDDLRVYNRWLTSDEITEQASATNSGAGVRIIRWVERQ